MNSIVRSLKLVLSQLVYVPQNTALTPNITASVLLPLHSSRWECLHEQLKVQFATVLCASFSEFQRTERVRRCDVRAKSALMRAGGKLCLM